MYQSIIFFGAIAILTTFLFILMNGTSQSINFDKLEKRSSLVEITRRKLDEDLGHSGHTGQLIGGGGMAKRRPKAHKGQRLHNHKNRTRDGNFTLMNLMKHNGTR